MALEVLVGDKTLAELAAKHVVHPNMIAPWKRQAKEDLHEVFSKVMLRSDTVRKTDSAESVGASGSTRG